MAVTYKTVIANAINGFNRIQNAIYTNSAQLSTASASDSESLYTIDEIVNALGPATLTALGPTIASNDNATLSTTDTSGILIRANGGAGVSSPGLVSKGSRVSKSSIKYLTDITVPSGKTLNSVNNSGAITGVSNSGTMTVLSNTSGLKISSNSGTTTIEADTGTTNYLGWTITQNSSGNLVFKYN